MLGSWGVGRGFYEFPFMTIVAAAVFVFLVTYTATAVRSALATRSTKEEVQAPTNPYWIPGLGNVAPFATDTVGFMKGVFRKYGETPVFLNLGFEQLYIFKGQQNLLTLFNRSKDMSTKALTMISLIDCFGLPKKDAKVYEDDVSGPAVKALPGSLVAPERRVFHLTHEGFTSLSGPALKELSIQFIRHFSKRVSAIEERIDEKWLELPDLYKFIRHETFLASTAALFGECILEVNENLSDDFWDFDSWMPLILKKIPWWIIPWAFQSRDRSRENIMRWHAKAQKLIDPADESLSNVYWDPVWGAKVIRDRAVFYNRIPEISPLGHAACDLGMLWGANANVGPIVGWSLFHIVIDKDLEKRVRKEIAAAFGKSGPSSVDLNTLSACHLLQSIVAEVLRVNVSLFIHRVPTTPGFKLGRWLIKENQLMITSIYFAHRDEEKWNTGSMLPDGKHEHPLDEFWAERFLEYPNDPYSGPSMKDTAAKRSHSGHETSKHNDHEARFVQDDPKMKGVYIPFGGGIFQCPGRFYAKNEILVVVAMMLWAFDIELVDLDIARKTGRNMKALGLGTFSPDRENPFRIRRRKQRTD